MIILLAGKGTTSFDCRVVAKYPDVKPIIYRSHDGTIKVLFSAGQVQVGEIYNAALNQNT